MTANLAPYEIVAASVTGLGYEMVDFEHSARGVMRVFIDKPDGIGVEDCANVSNHLTRVFLVENIEFERLEVSSPGLDRALKTLSNYQQYLGRAVKVRLNTLVDGRKRFDGVIEALEGETIIFGITDDEGAVGMVVKPKSFKKPKLAGTPSLGRKKISVAFVNIDKSRLIPEI